MDEDRDARPVRCNGSLYRRSTWRTSFASTGTPAPRRVVFRVEYYRVCHLRGELV